MPLPSPRKNQEKNSFISDCMSDPDMISEFPKQKQRAAVCHSQRKRRKAEGAENLNWSEWDSEENEYYVWW